MLSAALTFEFGPSERDVKVLLPHQILCIRQTAHTLEFLWAKGKGSTGVICVEGMNLGILRREILCGSRTTIQGGSVGPAWSRCTVTKLYPRLGWTRPKDRLALDPNPLPNLYVQMETGTTRDLWGHEALDRFAVPRGTAEKLLLQFASKHAYILHTVPTEFLDMLRQLRKANFTYAMTNRFSVFSKNPYPSFPKLGVDRYIFQAIDYVEHDLASKSEWDVIIDFAGNSGPLSLDRSPSLT